jgi:hypothetical protein
MPMLKMHLLVRVIVDMDSALRYFIRKQVVDVTHKCVNVFDVLDEPRSLGGNHLFSFM